MSNRDWYDVRQAPKYLNLTQSIAKFGWLRENIGMNLFD